MKNHFRYAAGAAALILSSPAPAQLSRSEQAMITTVDAEQQRTISMLERWVNQNSGTMNKAGVEAVRDLVEPEFRKLGFKTQWIDMNAVGRAGRLSRAAVRPAISAAKLSVVGVASLVVCLTGIQ